MSKSRRWLPTLALSIVASVAAVVVAMSLIPRTGGPVASARGSGQDQATNPNFVVFTTKPEGPSLDIISSKDAKLIASIPVAGRSDTVARSNTPGAAVPVFPVPSTPAGPGTFNVNFLFRVTCDGERLVVIDSGGPPELRIRVFSMDTGAQLGSLGRPIYSDFVASDLRDDWSCAPNLTIVGGELGPGRFPPRR